MGIDPSRFHRSNIADTCAIWNVLASRLLYRRAREAGVAFGCTRFVLYECLYKPRSKPCPSDAELQKRLKEAQASSDFVVCTLDVADLQTIEVLENRKRIGKGELSSIAFASKSGQAFLTDDQKARRLANGFMGNPGAQTTPHLLAWLFFENRLADSDKQTVTEEHTRLGRPLAPYFEKAYLEALRCRLMAKKNLTDN
jgi:hypothetical protein